MSKHINVNMLIKKYIDTDIEKFSNSDVKIVLENLKQNILKAPNIDIVHCRECEYGQDDLFHMFCAYHHHKTYADDFCSYGERSSK